MLLLEKEASLAAHQSRHNSGVIHAGVYYAPGSLKAEFCRQGAAATYAFARRHDVPVEQCGKLIVATEDVEVERLNALYARCEQNRLEPQMLDEAALRELEPRIAGRAAIRVATSGIADYPGMTETMARLAQRARRADSAEPACRGAPRGRKRHYRGNVEWPLPGKACHRLRGPDGGSPREDVQSRSRLSDRAVSRRILSLAGGRKTTS